MFQIYGFHLRVSKAIKYRECPYVFDYVSKHLELSLKNSAGPHFSTFILSVWQHDQTLV